MITCYRSVVRHPFLVGMGFLLILMYRLFPLLFSLLVSVSPVIVSTAVLLGTLLSFGQPNIPEIEIEKEVEKELKSDKDVIQKLESKVMSDTEIVGRDLSFGFVETNGSRIEIGDKICVDDDDNVLISEEKCENLQFGEECLVEEGENEVGDHGIDLDEEKVVSGSDYAPLRQSEEDENVVLESDDKLWEGSADPLNSDSGLLWKRMEGDDDDDDSEDDDGSDSGSDLAESSSPDASMADIIPMLDELHPLLGEESETREPAHIPRDGTDASDSSSESNDDDGGIENHEELGVGDDEDKESKRSDKEGEIGSVITWTEDDQKNLMNLGTSELERNRRLENLIARRRARKTMRMQAEKNLIDLESADLPWNIPPISTARNNPFDMSYDSNDNVPGSAPSVMLQRRNPFDLPYDSSEEKPDLVGDTFQQEFAAVQPKEPFFRRHESFNVGPSIFGASRSERQETKLRPYFVPERIASDGTHFSSFQRQLSELSDSKVTDTESVSSAGDLENKGHIEDDLSLEPAEKEHEHDVSDDVIEVTPYFVPEQVASAFHRQISELSESKVSSVPDTESISSASDLENKDPIDDESISINEHEQVELISKREPAPKANEHASEDDGNVESNQVEKEDDELDEISAIGNVTNQQEVASGFRETENADSSVELVSDATHVNLGDQGLHSRASSLSSLYEVSDQIYHEKDDDETPTSVAETDYYFVERGNSIETSGIDVTSLSVDESQPKEPIYDSSPRAVAKNLSSSSISTVSEKGTGSVSGRESQETVQKTVTECAGNDAEFVDSSKHDAAEEIESRSITDNNLIELDHPHNDKGFQHAEDQQQASSSVAVVKRNSTDSNSETTDAQNQIPTVPDNEECLSAGDSISTSLSNKPIFETEDGLLDMDAYGGVDREEVISQREESCLLGSSVEEPSAEDPEELEGDEVERGHVASLNSEARSEEVVHREAFESEEEAILHPHKEFPLLGTSGNKPFEENPEVLQVQINSNNSDNLQIQEPENNISPSINSVSSPEPDVVEVTGIETKAPETLAYTGDIHSIESKNAPDNIDDVEEINEIDENLLVELDAVGDFSVKDLGLTSNEIKEDQHASVHDLENKHSNEDSYSNDLGSSLNETKRDPHASEHDLEDNPSVDEDSYSKDLGSTLNEMKQDPHGSEHDIETKRYGDEDSCSKDLGSNSNEMKQDPHASEHDLETNSFMDLGSISNEMISDPHASEHVLETNRSVDEDLNIEDLESSLNEMKQEPRDSGAHSLETFYSVEESAFIKDIESTLNEMKQDRQTLDHDDSTVFSEKNINTDAEERTKPEGEKEISDTEVAGASEASSSAMVNDGRENVLSTSNTDNKE
ncbi:hypothetical protein L6452_03923 [Arctium lappa]|uniref:Uncharacterized protein n=1 Tax=Arctium lappa TaxID=4217 RepID=A0ACB9FPH6_ARCLA|nr:hypothetical protein L6452_03923 [Arctium lappa]